MIKISKITFERYLRNRNFSTCVSRRQKLIKFRYGLKLRIKNKDRCNLDKSKFR